MKHRTIREQMQRKCVHFNGLQNKSCRAGCNYDDMDRGRRIAYRAALPCFIPDNDEQRKLDMEGISQCKCENFQLPTEEEISAHEKSIEEHMRKMNLALEVIAPIRQKYHEKDWSGTIECPICKGKLFVSHSGYNGHVHAKCETHNCVSWME